MAAAATESPQMAPDFPGMPLAPAPEPKLSALRWGMRGLLLLLGGAALYLNAASDPSPSRQALPSGWSEAETLVLTLDAASTYGRTAVSIGQPSEENPPLEDDSALQAKLQEAQPTQVLLQIAGSVSQQELMRYQALIRQSLPKGDSAEFAYLLLPRP